MTDVVIVGAGIAGALIAHKLGKAGKQVVILEAGAAIPPNINAYMERFYKSDAKVPESPYTPELFDKTGKMADPKDVPAGRQNALMLSAENWQEPAVSYAIQKGKRPFASTYERIGGGTSMHWLGTSLRLLPSDFKMEALGSDWVEMQRGLGSDWMDWPIAYDDDLKKHYADAEAQLGVSADAAEQDYLKLGLGSYEYPMPGIPLSLLDQTVAASLKGKKPESLAGPDVAPLAELVVRSTPAARNSRPYQGRRACAGNTNCIPICPIQAKYDPSVTLNEAFETGNVEILYRTVATEVVIDANGRVTHIEYKQYETENGPHTNGRVSAKVFVIAAHAIETPKLLLMSTNGGHTPDGVANSSGQVGRNLMDHPIYLAWALAPQQVFGYRGPLSTSGIESLRDGKFRSERAAFRIEIGNEGWNFPIGDPFTTTLDFINGGNNSKLNPAMEAIYGANLVTRLNSVLSRQFRLGFLVEQSPEDSNRVTLSEERDNLNLPRPEITYNLSDYTKKGMAAAKQTADKIFASMNATQFTNEPSDDPSSFEWPIDGKLTRLRYYGAGHIVGTYRMGSNKNNSVVNHEQRSWDHQNLFLVGSGTFPTVATANPTLTLAALTLRTADVIKKDLT
jgi:choline dehydrogenase-like flavoprotein